uniref:Uncharacterized protein n=1 Tax=Cacopsylla melanoneura TaxID=428564 RepID=A0A8D8TCK3_9HEMI
MMWFNLVISPIVSTLVFSFDFFLKVAQTRSNGLTSNILVCVNILKVYVVDAVVVAASIRSSYLFLCGGVPPPEGAVPGKWPHPLVSPTDLGLSGLSGDRGRGGEHHVESGGNLYICLNLFVVRLYGRTPWKTV